MTAPLPISWQVAPTYLNIPGGGTLLFVEKTDPVRSLNNERWSANQNDAAEMTFATKWAYIVDPVGWPSLYTSIIGGYSPVANKKFTPFQHPYRAGYFAKDVVSIGSVGLNDGASFGITGQVQPYQLAEIRVSFEQLPYKVNVTASASPLVSPNFVSVEDRACNDRLQMPGGSYVFTSGGTSTTGRRAIQGLWLTRGLIYKIVTLHRVPEQYLYGNSDAAFLTTKPAFSGYTGCVNQNTIFGCDPNKLLLDSVETRVYGGHPQLQFKEYEVDLNFIYANNVGGFNAAFDIVTQQFQPVSSSLSGGTPPFTLIAFENFINILNPASISGATF